MHLYQKAKEYAIICHRSTNHSYGDFSYEHHLNMVVDCADAWIHLIPEQDRETVFAGCWVHDVIEDCRQTYNDVKKATNEQVAELAYALTNEKGKNRKERANDKYYAGIRSTPYAIFIKLCDRAANMKHSIQTDSRMAEMYRKEMPEFCRKLNDETYRDLLNYLLTL